MYFGGSRFTSSGRSETEGLGRSGSFSGSLGMAAGIASVVSRVSSCCGRRTFVLIGLICVVFGGRVVDVGDGAVMSSESGLVRGSGSRSIGISFSPMCSCAATSGFAGIFLRSTVVGFSSCPVRLGARAGSERSSFVFEERAQLLACNGGHSIGIARSFSGIGVCFCFVALGSTEVAVGGKGSFEVGCGSFGVFASQFFPKRAPLLDLVVVLLGDSGSLSSTGTGRLCPFFEKGSFLAVCSRLFEVLGAFHSVGFCEILVSEILLVIIVGVACSCRGVAVSNGGFVVGSPGTACVDGGGFGVAGSLLQVSSTILKVGSSGTLVLKLRLCVGVGAGVVTFGGANVFISLRGIVLLVPPVCLVILFITFGPFGVVGGQSLRVGGSLELGGSLTADLVNLVLVASHVLSASASLFYVFDGVSPVFAASLTGQTVERSPADAFLGLFDARAGDAVEISSVVDNFDVEVVITH